MNPRGATGRFSRSDRLLDSRDFRRVLRRGRRRAHRDVLVVTARVDERFIDSRDLQTHSGSETRLPSGPLGRRLGITASRKVGGAVVRNRFKRRVREWFRSRRGDLPHGVDVIVIARRSGARLSLSELDDRLSGLLDLPRRGAPEDAEPLGVTGPSR